MQSTFFLNVVIGKSATILQLLASEDQTLLVRWNALLILDLGLNIVNGIRSLHVKCDRFAGQSFDEDLHTTTEAKNQMQSTFFLNVVIGKSATILQLLASEDQTLLVGWNALLILDLGLNIVNGIRGLHIKRD